MTAGQMAELLAFLPRDLPVVVISSDDVEEFPFAKPTLYRFNLGTSAEFVGIRIEVGRDT